MEKTAIDELISYIEVFAELSSSEYVKVHGPYARSNRPEDKRKIVIIIDKDGKKRTISLPKFLYEEATGIKLAPNESIDHKDCDIDNNSLDNLFVIDRAEHSKLDTRRVEPVEFECQECHQKFKRLARHIREKARTGKAGPFCSKSCSGKYSRRVQLGLSEKLPAQTHIDSIYFKQKHRNITAMAEFLIEKYASELDFLADE